MINNLIVVGIISLLMGMPLSESGDYSQQCKKLDDTKVDVGYVESSFCKALMKPGVRILAEKGWYIWDPSPILGKDGKFHVFYSRWRDDFRNWQNSSEVVHAVSDRPEGPYRFVGTVLRGRGADYWDASTIHNPTIQKVGSKYVIFYMANNLFHKDKYHGQPWVGMAVSDDLYGEFKRVGNAPILPMPDADDWDSFMNNNPALLQHPDGKYWLYYKGKKDSKGLRKIGVAFADKITGPYRRYKYNPVLDLSQIGKQIEDPYVFYYKKKFYMICRDMGVIDSHAGLLFTSEDGLHWSDPELAYHNSSYYFGGEPDRFERPQILFLNGRPAYLFLALKGGEYGTSTGAVLKIDTTKF